MLLKNYVYSFINEEDQFELLEAHVSHSKFKIFCSHTCIILFDSFNLIRMVTRRNAHIYLYLNKF